MGTGIRWTPETLADFQKRRGEWGKKGVVSTHKIQDDYVVPRGAAVKRTKRGPSELELLFARQLSDIKAAPPKREFKFMANRDFRLDYAWPERKLAVEVQGMVHRIKERFLRDVEKLAMAQIHGWTVLLVAGQDVRSGRAISWFVTLLEQK